MRHVSLFLTLGAAIAMIASNWSRTSTADAPWQRLNLFNSVEADSKKDYKLTRENGPWMIMAATFAGPKAHQQAHELALELRSEYKMPAFIHAKTFDYTGSVRGRGVNRFNRPKKMRYLRFDNTQKSREKATGKAIEVVVLVGNYLSVNDRQAQKDLQRIKRMKPDALDYNKERGSAQQLAWWRQVQKSFPTNNHKTSRGPMSHAFFSVNPIAATDRTSIRGVDKFVADELNRGVKYSLLDCKGKYTVQVASFSGKSIIDQKRIMRIQQGNDQQSDGTTLMKAAEKANIVCTKLRKLGYEAYEFHDRQGSIVTVGSFESVGTSGPGGKTIMHPTVHKVIKAFSPSSVGVQGYLRSKQSRRPGINRQPKTVSNIQLELQPIPVEVPRRSYAADFLRRPNRLR